jgi:hypothetical protein
LRREDLGGPGRLGHIPPSQCALSAPKPAGAGESCGRIPPVG